MPTSLCASLMMLRKLAGIFTPLRTEKHSPLAW